MTQKDQAQPLGPGSRAPLEPKRCYARSQHWARVVRSSPQQGVGALVCNLSPQGVRYERINWIRDYYGLMLKVNIFLLNIKNKFMNLDPSIVINGLMMASC